MLVNENNISKLETLVTVVKQPEVKFTIQNYVNELLFYINMFYPDEYNYHLNKINSLVSEIENYVINKKQRRTTILGLGGGFSAGKSRFINSLLGISVLPEDIGATTAIATQVSYADVEYFNVHNVFDDIIPIDQQQMSNLRHGIHKDYHIELSKIIKKIYYFSPNIPWENISFLDTPGHSKADYSQDASDEQIALQSLRQTDYILWLVSADNGTIREDDIAFLQKLDSEQPKYIIVTKSDLRSTRDIPLIIQSIRDNLDKNGITYEGITAWSAPISKNEGMEVYGDSVIQWINRINQSPRVDIFTQFFEYIKQLHGFLKDKRNSLEESFYKKRKLYKKIGLKQNDSLVDIQAVDNFLRKNSIFDEDVYIQIANYYDFIGDKDLASNYFFKLIHYHEVIDWLFENSYYNENIANNLRKSIQNLTHKSVHKKDAQSCDVLIYIYEKFLTGSDYFYELVCQKTISAQCHNNNTSWEWLFDKAVNYKDIRESLASILDLKKANNKGLRYFKIEYEVGNKNRAIDGIFCFAEQNHVGSIDWLYNESRNNKELLYRLGEFYFTNKRHRNPIKAFDLFCESAIAGNKNAIPKLYQVVNDLNATPYVKLIIDIYDDIKADLRSDMLEVYGKLICNGFVVISEAQKEKLLMIFYNYIFKYNDESIFNLFIKVIHTIGMPNGYFLLADIYANHDRLQNFEQAYYNYSIVAKKDNRALYNKNVLTYYGSGTKKSMLKFTYLLIVNRDKKFFRDSYFYLFSQIIGFKEPLLVGVRDRSVEFESYYIKPTFFLIFYIFISIVFLYGTYHAYDYYDRNFSSKVNIEDSYEPTKETKSIDVQHDEYKLVSDEQKMLNEEIRKGSDRLRMYEKEIHELMSKLPVKIQQELQHDDWVLHRNEICEEEANQSHENYDIAYLNCMIRETESRINHIEELTKKNNQDYLHEHNDAYAEERSDGDIELIKAKEALDLKKKEFNQFWNTMPKSLQGFLIQEQKEWVEKRDEICLRISYEDNMSQELLFTQCVTRKLDERLNSLKSSVTQSEWMVTEFEQTKNDLEKTKKKFNRFWNSMPADVQNTLQQEQMDWLQQRDSICAQKVNHEKSMAAGIIENKCINDLLKKRHIELSGRMEKMKE